MDVIELCLSSLFQPSNRSKTHRVTTISDEPEEDADPIDDEIPQAAGAGTGV
jgi:hypothetical protein